MSATNDQRICQVLSKKWLFKFSSSGLGMSLGKKNDISVSGLLSQLGPGWHQSGWRRQSCRACRRRWWTPTKGVKLLLGPNIQQCWIIEAFIFFNMFFKDLKMEDHCSLNSSENPICEMIFKGRCVGSLPRSFTFHWQTLASQCQVSEPKCKRLKLISPSCSFCEGSCRFPFAAIGQRKSHPTTAIRWWSCQRWHPMVFAQRPAASNTRKPMRLQLL